MAVSGKLDDAPVTFPDFRIAEFASVRLQLGEGTFLLISLHEATVAEDIGLEWRRACVRLSA